MEWTDNPERDAERYYMELEKQEEAHRPKCHECGELLYKQAYEIDGELFCVDCLNEYFKVDIENFMLFGRPEVQYV